MGCAHLFPVWFSLGWRVPAKLLSVRYRQRADLFHGDYGLILSTEALDFNQKALRSKVTAALFLPKCGRPCAPLVTNFLSHPKGEFYEGVRARASARLAGLV